jgi:hypothetical protein
VRFSGFVFENIFAGDFELIMQRSGQKTRQKKSKGK